MLSTTNGFSRERSLFRNVEGRIVYESFDNLAAKFGVQDGTNDRQQTLMGLSERVDRQSDRLTWNEMERWKFELEMRRLVEKQMATTEEVSSMMNLYSETLGGLYYRLRVLESVALDYPFKVNVAACRQLCDARYYIADGVLTVFSGLYNRELIMDNHDPLGKALRWNLFKGALSTHFWRLHSRVTLVDRSLRTCGFELIQRESVFADCYAKRLYTIGSLAHVWITPQEFALAAVACGRFDDKIVKTFPAWIVEGGKPVAEVDMKVMLTFLIPALAWAYTELKGHIFRADSIIQALEKSIAKQRHLIEHPVELVPVEVSKSSSGEMEKRFAHGTALDVRKEAYWKSYVEGLGVAGIEQGRKLYNCWLEEEGIYDVVEQEEASLRAEEAKAASETAFPLTESSPAFTSPANGIKHTSSIRRVSNQAGCKRSSNDVNGSQDGESSIKARKMSGSSSPPARVLDEKGASVNVNNAKKALNADEERLEKVRKRRKIHTARLASIYKCLAILLDPDLLEFVVLGESFIHEVVNQRIPKSVIDRDGELERDSEPVGSHRCSTGEKFLEERRAEQVSKLLDLSTKCDEELCCFDNPDITLPMEIALDEHLSVEARVSSELKNPDDIHLFMSYLNDVCPALRD